MSKVYLIEQSSGYYDDYRTNVIKAFKDKEQADKYKEKYNALLTRLQDHCDDMIKATTANGEYYDSVFNYSVSEQNQCRLIEIELL